MVKKFIGREKYIIPLMETEGTVPDILCESYPNGGLEEVGQGDDWSI